MCVCLSQVSIPAALLRADRPIRRRACQAVPVESGEQLPRRRVRHTPTLTHTSCARAHTHTQSLTHTHSKPTPSLSLYHPPAITHYLILTHRRAPPNTRAHTHAFTPLGDSTRHPPLRKAALGRIWRSSRATSRGGDWFWLDWGAGSPLAPSPGSPRAAIDLATCSRVPARGAHCSTGAPARPVRWTPTLASGSIGCQLASTWHPVPLDVNWHLASGSMGCQRNV